MKRFALAPALVLLGIGSYAALNAQAAPQLPGQPDPARVAAGQYTVDGGHTLIGWRVDHFGFNDYFGIFGDVAGTLQLDPDDLTATKLDVTIPIARVTVASAGLRDHLLRPGKDGGKPDFFGPEPADARFVSTAVQRTGADTADIAGNLTLNGVTRPVTVAARFIGAGANPMNKRETIGFEGTTTIKRSDFGIAYVIPMVSDEVELDITAAFEKAGAATPPAAADACNTAAAGEAIGRKDTPALRAEVARDIGHSRIRWLPPGSVVTHDLREDRLNVDIDAGGVMVRVRCG